MQNKQAVDYNREQILDEIKENKKFVPKLDKLTKQRVKETELKHFKNKYVKRGQVHPLPDFLQPFKEPLKTDDVKKVAK